ncbi:hypothetical protein B0I35DRAFT_439588 [Stachybotrys elegans]|uniref:Zn(2)-C6 fungal-type domain-containing protein n=1 Tax=Stachybotrys elegans TaxID=80388 RepID=A0A8K0SNP1_9HYPO|nr:hypothetical protein B0I35DRAFT_439588 [Stachybotrys elegans]
MTQTRSDEQPQAQKQAACVACSKAKRRCSKHLPACHRCLSKKLDCAYPVTVAMVSSSATSLTNGTARHDLSTSDASLVSPLLPDGSLSLGGPPGPVTPRAARLDLQNLWFLKFDSWQIDSDDLDDNRITYPDSGIDYFLGSIKKWLDQWTRENHCAFIHQRLYGTNLPAPLQYAYATWLAYRASTGSANKKIAIDMALRWSRNLVQEQSIYQGIEDDALDLITHLSRTQTLFIFQMICLFDGDIRARSQAETHSSTLVKWCDAAMRRAAIDVASGPSPSPGESINEPEITQLRAHNTPASTWKAWILSESIRRVWILATLTEAAFLIKKQGFSMCPGSIGFTCRSGVWDSLCHQAWLACIQSESTVDIPRFCKGLYRLMDVAIPTDADEFALVLLAYGKGKETLDEWLAFGRQEIAQY